ncbi:protein kinase [Verrucomicrobiaceae bacterium N1E253]|uniref:Protein kinase n=1 Tax=Oceaniferula marina TaxID=2748318 RepID=A0A851GI12_9BACT|nr:serine/threonine-protein kinase [Oceaniferula marina]NWK55511.1 protein kinase [Oceaniferula marina]
MSTERYEIKGKIGEGGVGAVYHAYDTHLNRDVAIKRVLADGGYEDQEDATKSLLKEATALSSVQHPHIVTVYDAGIDSDGPYVVMELIHGRTLDEMVERATMTWDDLREVALQSQEALIAAQDLDLVHRDLKPSNIMVCWLPSGKFQIKIVDFGLAKFSAAPSLQTIAHGDAVFGSIFFMAPEQFERIPLDKCTDMYSMGCLYYFALTGEYPFNGDTAAAVMASHLQHHVTPLHELRPDIPKWGADWIMWHIEREMSARPQDAREALGRFLLLDQQSTQPITVSADNPDAAPAGAPAAGAPKLLFPEAGTAAQPTAATSPVTPQTSTQAVNPLTSQQPIAPPNATQNVHTAAQQVQPAAQPATGPQLQAAQPITGGQTAQPGTAPQVAQLGTGPQPPQAGTAAQAGMPPQAQEAQAAEGIVVEAPKKGLPPVAKWTIIGLLALVIIVTGVVIKDQLDKRKAAKLYTNAMADAKELYDNGKLQDGFKLDQKTLQIILDRATDITFAEKERTTQRAALAYAVGDSFDADAIIVEHITTVRTDPGLRSDLFKYVMTRRKKPSNIKPLLDFALETKHPNEATQAILAAKSSCEGPSAEDYLGDFLSLLKNTDNDGIRSATESAVAKIIEESSSKEKFGNIINNSYISTLDDTPAKYALLRLLAFAGGEKAGSTVEKALNSDDLAMQNAAIAALGKWADDSQFEILTTFIDETDSTDLRKKAFTSAYRFLTMDRDRDPDDLGDLWRSLADTATSSKEKVRIIQGLANQNQNWALVILDKYIKDSNDEVIDKAEQAKERVERNIDKTK